MAAACAGTGPPWRHRFAAAVHGTPGDRLTFRSAERTEVGEPSYGVALLTRYEVAEWHELRLPPGRARLPVPLPPGSARRVLWAPDEQRVALAAVLATPAGPLSVVSTHLSFSPPQAIKQLRRLAAWSAALPRPLILLGDLNLPGRIPELLTGFQPLLRAATYPSSRPRLQLDHVLADGDVRVAVARAVPVGGSDHRAAVADLELLRPRALREGGPRGEPGCRRRRRGWRGRRGGTLDSAARGRTERPTASERPAAPTGPSRGPAPPPGMHNR